jgi:hypothetical protein
MLDRSSIDDPPGRLRFGKAGKRLRAEIGEIEQPADLPARRFAEVMLHCEPPGAQR